MIAMPVNCFVTEPISHNASVGIGMSHSTTALPYPLNSSVSLPLTTAATRPVTRFPTTGQDAIESRGSVRLRVDCATAAEGATAKIKKAEMYEHNFMELQSVGACVT